jgi:RNA polymerase sigma-70 factor (ECF subfamily)
MGGSEVPNWGTEQLSVSERILAARSGSSDSLGQLLDACRGYLLLVANAELDPRLHAKGGASDLVQETFLEAQQNFLRFRGQSQAELLAWLRRILLSHLANFSRRYRKTGKRRMSSEVRLDQSGSCDGLHDRLAEPGAASPSWCAVAREELEIMERALESLSPDDRAVILLVHRDHLSFVQAAQIMNRSADAVRGLWSRAVERLAREVEAAYGRS